MKSHIAFQMVTLNLTLNDLERSEVAKYQKLCNTQIIKSGYSPIRKFSIFWESILQYTNSQICSGSLPKINSNTQTQYTNIISALHGAAAKGMKQ